VTRNFLSCSLNRHSRNQSGIVFNAEALRTQRKRREKQKPGRGERARYAAGWLGHDYRNGSRLGDRQGYVTGRRVRPVKRASKTKGIGYLDAGSDIEERITTYSASGLKL
jgi:hypothetical protein